MAWASRHKLTHNQHLANCVIIWLVPGQLASVPESQRIRTENDHPNKAHGQTIAESLLDAKCLCFPKVLLVPVARHGKMKATLHWQTQVRDRLTVLNIRNILPMETTKKIKVPIHYPAVNASATHLCASFSWPPNATTVRIALNTSSATAPAFA